MLVPFIKESLDTYLRTIADVEPLAPEEEHSLAVDFYENKTVASAEKLVIHHLPLVVKMAFKYKNYRLSLMDLIQEGNIGLMIAVKNFDPYKGNRLSTYAMWWIKAYMRDFVVKNWNTISVGSIDARRKLLSNLGKIKRQMQQDEAKLLTIDQAETIAGQLQISKQDVVDIDTVMYGPKNISKDDCFGYDNPLEENLSAATENVEDELLESIDEKKKCKQLETILAKLDPRERQILLDRRIGQVTLEELSKRYKVSRERVRQIENKALEKAKALVSS